MLLKQQFYFYYTLHDTKYKQCFNTTSEVKSSTAKEATSSSYSTPVSQSAKTFSVVTTFHIMFTK